MRSAKTLLALSLTCTSTALMPDANAATPAAETPAPNIAQLAPDNDGTKLIEVAEADITSFTPWDEVCK